MRIAIAAALALAAAAFAPQPAHATAGLVCKGPGGARPWISLIFAAGRGGLAGAALQNEKGGWRSTMYRGHGLALAGRAIDLRRVSVRLVDLRGRPVAHLRARLAADGRGSGTLTVGGRTRPVRCAQD